MPRKVFFSFHFEADHWRANQVRNIGTIEGNQPVSGNDWETIKRGGDDAIKRWIDGQLNGRDCTIVLIGAETAWRPWIEYEIKESWQRKMGVVGIHIHRLLDFNQRPSPKGASPFSHLSLGTLPLDDILTSYDPPGLTSQHVYRSISNALPVLVQRAITIRKAYT